MDAHAVGPDLAHLVEVLGPGVVLATVLPADGRVAVGEAVIFERGQRLAPRDVVLAVGVDVGGSEALGLIDQAAAAGAAAVVFKVVGGALPEAVADAASRQRVALIGVPAGAMWGQLHSLVRTACSLEGPTSPGPGGGAPLGDLFAVANAIAAMVGGAVTVEDPSSRVLAFSTLDQPIDPPRQATILGQRIPGQWIERLRRQGVFRRLHSGEPVMAVPADVEAGLRPRLVAPVSVGGELLGSLWVVEGDRPFDDRAAEALTEAARAVAPHLVRHRSGLDVERQRRRQVVTALLDGVAPTAETLAVLGAPTSTAWSVVALEAADATPAGDVVVAYDRLVDLVALYSEAMRRHATAVAARDRVYVVVPAHDRVVELASELVAQAADSLHLALHAGVGSPTEALAELWRSRREADQVLRVLADGAAGSVAHIDGVRPAAILDELRDLAEREPALLAGPVEVLREHDRRSGSGYVETLRAWLDAFGDVTAAAAAIHVHPNTFRYRMRRLVQIAGIDLDDPDARLVLHLQLRLSG